VVDAGRIAAIVEAAAEPLEDAGLAGDLGEDQRAGIGARAIVGRDRFDP
jgi:hypothetical protein